MSKLSHSIYLSVIAILGVVVIWLVCDAPVDTNRNAVDRPTISSIAVLPFVALGSDDSATQVAQTITSRLVQILSNKAHVKVVPERDTRVFAETSKSVREIGDELSVSTVLEGSVRQTKDRVHVAAQLVDIETDTHLWIATYDQNIGDLEGVLSDIERAIMTFARD